jgi:hypothetical protein
VCGGEVWVWVCDICCLICHHWFVEIRLILEVTLRNSLESLWLYVFSSMNERCTVLSLTESLQKWMSYPSASWYCIVSGFPESCHTLEGWLQFHWLGNTKPSLSTPCVCWCISRIKVNSFLCRYEVNSCSHFEALASQCVRLHVLMKLGTQSLETKPPGSQCAVFHIT